MVSLFYFEQNKSKNYMVCLVFDPATNSDLTIIFVTADEEHVVAEIAAED